MGGTQAAPAECEDDDTDRDAEPAEEEFEFVGGTQASPPDEDETEPAGAVPETRPRRRPSGLARGGAQADSPAAAPQRTRPRRRLKPPARLPRRALGRRRARVPARRGEPAATLALPRRLSTLPTELTAAEPTPPAETPRDDERETPAGRRRVALDGGGRVGGFNPPGARVGATTRARRRGGVHPPTSPFPSSMATAPPPAATSRDGARDGGGDGRRSGRHAGGRDVFLRPGHRAATRGGGGGRDDDTIHGRGSAPMQIEAVAAAAAAARGKRPRRRPRGDVREGDVRVALDSQTADAEDEVPLSAVASPDARPRVGGGAALAAAMNARRRRQDLGMAGMSLSLGPPTEAERADAEADAEADAAGNRKPLDRLIGALGETQAPDPASHGPSQPRETQTMTSSVVETQISAGKEGETRANRNANGRRGPRESGSPNRRRRRRSRRST